MEVKVPAQPRAEPNAQIALPQGYALADLKERHGLTGRVVDTFDFAAPNNGGFRDDDTSSVISRPGLRPYRVSGTEHTSWFRARLQVANPGKPHLLLVEYPDDVHRWTMLSVRHEGEWAAGSGVDWLGVEGGYGTGWAYPLSGKERLYSTLIYPRRSTVTLYFSSFLHGGLPAVREISKLEPITPLYGAAASRAWLIEVDALPANTVEEPLSGIKRAIGDHRQNSETMFCDFGGPTERDTYRRGVAYLHREWTQKAFANYFDYSAWLGLNYFDQVAMDENSHRMYPSQVFKNDRKDTEDTLQITLDAARNLSTDVSFTFFGLVGVPREREDLKEMKLVDEKGTMNSLNLSLVYPEVQQYFIDLILEVAKRSKDSPRFKGVTIMMQKFRPPLFGIPGYLNGGFEEASLQAFSAATGKSLEGGDFPEKVRLMKGPLREDVRRWRSGLVHDWILRLRDEIKKVRSDLTINLYPHVDGPDPRFYGFDRALYKDRENIRVFESPASTDQFPGLIGDGRAKWKDLKPESSTDVLEFMQDYFETRTTWMEQTSATLMPNKEHILGPLIATLVRKNPRVITFHSWVRSTVGFDLELREFVRAFRSLPYAPATEVSDAIEGAAKEKLKVFRFGDKGAVQYFAVVNTGNEALAASVKVEGAGAVRDLVNGHDLPSQPNGALSTFEANVPAYGLRTYRVGK